MRAAWIAAAALAVVSTSALAQGGPIRLTPPTNFDEQGRPIYPEINRRDPAPAGIRVEGLGDVRYDSIGIINDEGGGLGRDMWEGTQRGAAIGLLRDLPEVYPYRASYELARKLLSTSADAPRGIGGNADLFSARIDKLAAIGAADSAIELAESVAGTNIPPELADSAVRAYFAAGDVQTACRVADAYRGGYSNAFWQQTLIVCRVAEGNPDQVALVLDLLREQSIDLDPAFRDAAIAVSTGTDVTLTRREGVSPDPLTLALAIAAGAQIPDWIVEDVAPGQLPMLYSTPVVDPDIRLAAAHRALRLGVADGVRASDVYNALNADPQAVAAGLAAPDSLGPDRYLAYLYLAAQARTEQSARAQALWDAWQRGRQAGAFDIVALTTADLLNGVPASGSNVWMAGTAAEVALMSGQYRQALEWYDLVQLQAPVNSSLMEANDRLWPAMHLIGRASTRGFDLSTQASAGRTDGAGADASANPVPWDPVRLERWLQVTQRAVNVPDQARVLALLAALGDPVSSAHWQAVARGDSRPEIMPNAAVLAGMKNAARQGARAETASFVLHALGGAGARPNVNVVVDAVEALGQVRLHNHARALAREAIVRETDLAAGP